VFLNVLRDALDSGKSAGDMLLAKVDLSTLFPAPAAEYVSARCGAVCLGSTVRGVTRDGDDLIIDANAGKFRYADVICAVAPYRAAALLRALPELSVLNGALERFQYQPIYSIYFQFAQSVRPPAPMLAIGDGAYWVFDREAICGQRGLLAAVISAEGPHQHMTHEALAQQIHHEIATELGPLPPLAWHRVIAEKRATFECSAGLERPATATPVTNMHLAGDYTAGDYPATLEAAVRSGIAAARAVMQRREHCAAAL
jgi:predicted NAD/FAD-binding protein